MMCDSDWEEVNSQDEDEEWCIPHDEISEIAEGFNPVPLPWFQLYQSRIDMSISFTVLKNFSCTGVDTLTGLARILTSRITEGHIRDVINKANDQWNQASIKFNLKSYKEIPPRSRYDYNVDRWRESYHRILAPYDSWDVDATINIFIVPYINRHILGTTFLWGPRGIGRQSYVLLSETLPTSLRYESPANMGLTLAHEIGHVLGLEHNPDQTHLMYRDDTRTDNKLSPDEARYSRVIANSLKTPRENGYISVSRRSHNPKPPSMDDPTIEVHINYTNRR